ncbi:MAG TPA: ABC transporter ATP-binding protein [Candidatus Polarisedimenticolia bacterium]|nr:ABC transporter ATP-binding protein [Candidatus Polarisedimenticolia bacterium]
MSAPHGGAPGRSHHDEEVLGKAYDARLMRRIGRYVLPHRRLVAGSLALLLLVSAVQLAQPYLIKLAIDGPIASKDPSGLLWIVAAFAALLALEFSLRFLQIYALEKTGQRVVHDLRVEVYDHLQKLSSSFFDRNPVGRLVTRVTTDVETLAEVFSSGVVTLLGDGLKLLGIVAILFWMDVRLATLTVTVLPLLGAVAFLFRIRIRDAFREVRARVARINAYLHETLSGMAVAQLFQRERANDAEFEEINRSHRDADLRSVVYDSIFSSIIELVGTLAVAMIVWYGGGRVLAGAVTFGTLVAFLEYAQKFFGPIKELGGYYSVMQSAMASSERIFALLDTRPEIASPASPRPLPAPASGRTGAVEFKGVRFAYPGGPPVLQGLTFRIRPGEKVAVVGSTGAGKSTIVRLLTRLYDVQSGSIVLDGADVRELELRELRRRVGVVLQDHVLFSGTLAGNIGLGDPSIGRDRIEAAARAVRADRFIQALPQGYDAEVRERGLNFSMGQRQLLSFARALAFDPPVLVLDEATASVDSATEMEIQAALRRLMAGRTSLVIAHRLSTIQESDRILVLHHGVVREEGTHQELLAREGIYRMLHRLQFQQTAAPAGAA